MNIYLIRHGKLDKSKDHFQLSAEGEAFTKRLASFFAIISIQMVACSRPLYCMQTILPVIKEKEIKDTNICATQKDFEIFMEIAQLDHKNCIIVYHYEDLNELLTFFKQNTIHESEKDYLFNSILSFCMDDNGVVMLTGIHHLDYSLVSKC